MTEDKTRLSDKRYEDDVAISSLVFQDIKWEHSRQFQKWGRQNLTLNEWLNFTIEELGELATAISDFNYREGEQERIYCEAIQVGALACKIADLTRRGMV